MTTLNLATRLRHGGVDVNAVHANQHRVWPRPRAYLVPPMVSTPVTPADLVSEGIRVRVMVHLLEMPLQVAAIAMHRGQGSANLGWDWRAGAAGQVAWRVSNNGTGLQVSGNSHPGGTLVPGIDQWLGVRFQLTETGTISTGEISHDQGVTWIDASTFTTAVPFAPFPSTANPTVGQLINGAAQLFPGRIYWAEVMAINRPEPNWLIWRFDAMEWPYPAPLTYTGVDARSWSQGALGAIVQPLSIPD